MEMMRMLKDIWSIRKVRRGAGYLIQYCVSTTAFFYFANTSIRAGVWNDNLFYASYPIGSKMLLDSSKLYRSALLHVFDEEDWGPLEYSIMVKHFQRQGKEPYAYHSQYMAHLLSGGHLDGTGGT